MVRYSQQEIDELKIVEKMKKVPVKEAIANLDEQYQATFKKFTRKGVVKEFLEGETIFYEGDESRELFIILIGQVIVYKQDNTIIAILEKGDIFGEFAVIEKQPRTASVKAKKDTKCLVLPHDSLEEVTKAYPTLYGKVMNNYYERVLVNENDNNLKNISKESKK
jgi:CRP-like cAMP-binding protein